MYIKYIFFFLKGGSDLDYIPIKLNNYKKKNVLLTSALYRIIYQLITKKYKVKKF